MATTVQNIIDRATQRSNLNDQTLISTSELYAYVTSFERHLFLLAARENPDFFGREGNTTARGTATDTWDVSTTPGNVAAVSRIEVSAITGSVTGVSVGDEVHIVSVRRPDVSPSPRVYLRNKTIHEYDSELQDDGSNYVTTLKVYYSFLPNARTASTDTLSIPDEFTNLIVIPLARVMAIRDQRSEEAAVLDQEFQFEMSTFLEQVSVFDEGAVRSLEKIRAANANLGVRNAQSGA